MYSMYILCMFISWGGVTDPSKALTGHTSWTRFKSTLARQSWLKYVWLWNGALRAEHAVRQRYSEITVIGLKLEKALRVETCTCTCVLLDIIIMIIYIIIPTVIIIIIIITEVSNRHQIERAHAL